MKFISILFIYLIIAISLVVSQQPTYKLTNLRWDTYQPVYTDVNDYVLMIDQNKQFVLRLSKDGGLNWSDNVKDSDNNVIKGVRGIYQQNGNIMVVNYSFSKGTSCSVSSDGGISWKTSVFPYSIQSISAHEYIDGTVIANSNQYIIMSSDFGLTWNNISEASGNYLHKSYGMYSNPLWDPSEKTAVFFAILAGSGNSGVFSVSKDLGKTFKGLINGAVDMIYTDNYFYVGVSSTGSGNKLYVKTLKDRIPTTMDGFLVCEFPFGEEVQPNDFRILDDSAGAIFMGIQTTKDGQSSKRIDGNVYVSNGAGNIFTLSLKHVSVGAGGYYDFMPLYGAPGSYIFNGVTNPQAAPGSPINTRSFISYDNGGRWSRMSPPKDMPCTLNPCKLNVHGLSAYQDQSRGYGPVYSIAAAPGLVIATGNANPALASNAPLNRIKTVFSNDNGQNWKVFYGNGSIYEFGAYGSTIIFASAVEDTNTVYYTFDQGTTMQSFSLPKAYDIINIITNPNNDKNKFILLVEDANDTPMIIGVDLTPVLPPVCTSAELTTFNTGCILGQNTTYQGVTPGKRCYLDAPVTDSNIQYCQCTVDDFECDIGYDDASDDSLDSSSSTSNTPQEDTLICRVSSNSNYIPITESNCVPGEIYYISKGYRRVAGSQCIGGVNSTYSPTMAMCPGGKSSGGGKGWIAAVIIGILVVAGGGFGFYVYKNPDMKQKLLRIVGMDKSGPKYSVLGIQPNSLADDEFGIEDDDAQILNDNDLQDDEDF